ncbi:MAG: penicillin-binding protein activator [Magnetococcales bacterium]|nr:penicillin-binding protein activator [Magnetococcales bacterium]
MLTGERVCLRWKSATTSGLSIGIGGLLGLLILSAMLAGGCTLPQAEKKARAMDNDIQAREPRPKVRMAQTADDTRQADDMIAEARKLVENNRIDTAMARYQTIIQRFGTTSQANEARYRLGNHLMLQGETSNAWSLLSDAASRTEQPYAWESLTLLGDLKARKGDLKGAWESWIKVARSTAPREQGLAAWQRLVKSYVQYGNAENTQHLLPMLPPGQLGQDQARMALATVDQIDTERLKQLYALQPSGSPLAPLLALILGDRQYQEGGTVAQGAKDYWQSARSNDFTSQEAQRRLAPGENQQTLVVGLLLPLSGDHATLGKNLLKASKKALRDYPDTRIVLKISDSHVKAEATKQAVEQLRADGVGAIIGPVFHEATKAAVEVAARHRLPILTLNPHAGIAQPENGVFQNAFIPENEAKFMARIAVAEKKLHRIAVLAPETEYGHLLTQAFSDAAQQWGGTVPRVAFFQPGSNDFSPWLKALLNIDSKDASPSAKDTAADFDGLFIPASAQDVRLIASQAAFFKIRPPGVTLMGTSLWNKPELFKEGTDFIKGAYFCDIDDTARGRFNTSFYQTWKENPTPLDMLAYDSVALLAQALRVERMSGQPWFSVLKGGQGIYGAAGMVYFDEKGQSHRNYSLYRIDSGGPTRQEPLPWQEQTPVTVLPAAGLPPSPEIPLTPAPPPPPQEGLDTVPMPVEQPDPVYF